MASLYPIFISPLTVALRGIIAQASAAVIGPTIAQTVFRRQGARKPIRFQCLQPCGVRAKDTEGLAGTDALPCGTVRDATVSVQALSSFARLTDRSKRNQRSGPAASVVVGKRLFGRTELPVQTGIAAPPELRLEYSTWLINYIIINEIL